VAESDVAAPAGAPCLPPTAAVAVLAGASSTVKPMIKAQIEGK
jgi:hypothetical protein